MKLARGASMTDFSVRDMLEADLPALFEIQADADGQFLAAFTDTSNDREKYLRKRRELLADDSVVSKVIVANGEVIGSVASFVLDGDTEVTYWIRRDFWGRGIATGALTVLLEEVTVRPVFARAVHDNIGSLRVLERNGFTRVGEEESFAEARQGYVKEIIFRLD
jgi:[ribosomal protein S5]-alanine N-acetyltransferase